MEPPLAPAMAAVDASEEEWELCIDEGFVYKRKKRRRVAGDEFADAAAATRSSETEIDPVEEERNLQKRKRKTLLKLKSTYLREIEQWEILSNSLSAMQEKTDRFQTRQREQLGYVEKTVSLPSSSSGRAREQGWEDASARPSLLEELFFMAEAQETMVEDISNLCEMAEEMCRMEDEERIKGYMDLPIWGSPRDLMVSLCDDKP